MKRILAGAFLISLLVTGCGNTDSQGEPRDVEYVQDGEWFDTDIYRTEIQPGFQSLYGDEMPNGVFYATSDEIVIRECYANNLGDEYYNKINKYCLGENGKNEIEFSFDLAEYSFISEDGRDKSTLQDLLIVDHDVYVVVNHNFFDGERTNHDFYLQQLNFETGELGPRIVSEDMRDMYLRDWGDVDIAWTSNNQIRMIVWKMSNNNYQNYLLTFNENFELISETPLENKLGLGGTFSSESAILFSNMEEGRQVFYRLDKASNVAEPMGNLCDDFYRYYSKGWKFVGQTAFSCDGTGVYEYDPQANEVTCAIDFDNCNALISRDVLNRVSYYDGNTAVIYAPSFGSGVPGYNFFRFTRAESNPNAGKALLRLASLDGVYDMSVMKSIYEFNRINNDAFIIIDDRYELDNFYDRDYSTSDSYIYDPMFMDNQTITEIRMAANNQLRVDIMAGNGPDILVNSYGISEINNGNCMLDLKELILEDESINPEEYINLIFDNNEEIYQLPLKVSPVCVFWIEDLDIEDTGTYGGITYEQYESLVSVDCNGEDPLSYYRGQVDYFVEMFNYRYDEFVHDGVIDINNEEFRAMAEFANSRSIEMLCEDYYGDWQAYPTGRYYDRLIVYPDLNHYNAYGMPSINGDRGIKLKCDMSIGIASSCPLVEEAVEFVKGVMMQNNCNIRLDDIRTSTDELVQNVNIKISNDMQHSMDLSEYDLLADDYTDKYINMLQNASGIYEYDASIAMIMYEEIQVYFSGDKTLDEIIPIIEDRCQTVLNEKSE